MLIEMNLTTQLERSLHTTARENRTHHNYRVYSEKQLEKRQMSKLVTATCTLQQDRSYPEHPC